ncbi:hypothetical protein MKLM6_4410 (plasmid) [Methylomonas koyamae]|nr:hypothetical protein MKLM6_4410 [Methylomonas koyamae]
MSRTANLENYRAVFWIFGLFWLAVSGVAAAEDTFCAKVSIEIKQELTLERQAFDAHMRINNGVQGFPVENVRVDVKFADEDGNPVISSFDPDNTQAKFFIRQDSLSGIENVTGTGVVAPASSADIHWLIIPAPGAAGQLAGGKLYFVGATLQYTLNGEAKTTEITPDFIYVKPMPQLTLDYFLPSDVFGDDAFTPSIEPPEPFTLGVRVSNKGRSMAPALKINSAQPRIVENELGLLINFRINGGFVNDAAVAPSLLLDFGDIAANSAKMGRWQMETTLSGKFIEFTADYSHADELGGELTSLMTAVNTHQLLRDVLVDLPGRDAIKDFLASDGSTLRVYESNGVDTQVTDQSAFASIAVSGQQGGSASYQLNLPVTAGFFFARIPDPQAGKKDVTRLLRADGKALNKANVWLSKTRAANHGWNYFINVFDQNGGGHYSLTMDDFPVVPHAPVLQFIADKTVSEGKSVGFIVEASDADGTVPVLTVAQLPAGAVFADRRDGVGLFSWTPNHDQAGVYYITFTASDGALKAQRTAKITVIDAPVATANYEVSFEAGFNIFTYPVQVAAQHQTCLGLLNSLGDATVVANISRFNTASQKVEQCSYASAGDFAIKAGDALAIQMLQQKTLQFDGEKTCPVWFVNPGPNYVGHPLAPAGFSCYDVANLTKSKVSLTQSFNKSNGRFESCGWDSQANQPIGVDFPIGVTDGLIVNAIKQELITLPGCE